MTEKEVWPPAPDGRKTPAKPKRRFPRWASVLLGALAGSLSLAALVVLLIVGFHACRDAGYSFGCDNEGAYNLTFFAVLGVLPAAAVVGFLAGGIIGAVRGRTRVSGSVQSCE